MSTDDKRLRMLESVTASETADAFAWYALALEYRRRERIADAVATFERLRDAHPRYLPTYLMAGQTLVDANRAADARSWLEQGVALAREKRDGKTLGELEAALADCEPS